MTVLEGVVAPFAWLVAILFDSAYALVGSLGWSVVLLALLVSALLLPVVVVLERMRMRDGGVKEKMAPRLAEIRRVYTGQERFYYTRTLYRQHGYSHWKALLPLLGLLLQIPFFIAAFQFLGAHSGIVGVGFGPIKDISRPDGLLGSVHLLPLLMTLVNLLTARLYAKGADPSERRQMYMVAFLFLVLLYRSSAALVLYWTVTNLVSLLRTLILDAELRNAVFRLTQRSRWGSVSGSLAEDAIAVLRRSVSAEGLLIPLSGIAYFSFSSLCLYGGTSIELFFLAAMCAFAFVILAWRGAKTGHWKGPTSTRGRVIGIAYLAALLVTMNWVLLFDVLLVDSVDLSVHQINKGPLTLLAILAGLGVVAMGATLLPSRQQKRFRAVLIVLLAGVHLFGTIVFWHPLQVYASSPTMMDTTVVGILQGSAGQFFSGMVACLLIAVFSPPMVREMLWRISLVLVFLLFVYNTLVPVDVGILAAGEYTHLHNLRKPIGFFVLEWIVLLTVVAFVWQMHQRRWFRLVPHVLVVLALATAGNALYQAAQSGPTSHDTRVQKPAGSNLLLFSKNNKNVVFFIADMFQGWTMEAILRDDERLREEYAGFVWFPNTLSYGSNTFSTFPSVLAGHDFSPRQMNQVEGTNANWWMMQSFASFSGRARQHGYRFSGTGVPYNEVNPDLFDHYISRPSAGFSNGDDAAEGRWQNDQWTDILRRNAVLLGVPLAFKTLAFAGSVRRKRGADAQVIKSANDYVVSGEYQFVDTLPAQSVAIEGQGNFIFIQSWATHAPHGYLDEDGQYWGGVSLHDNHKWFIHSFRNWLQWMKEEGVYDNTRILLLSDHGVAMEHFRPDHLQPGSVPLTGTPPPGMGFEKLCGVTPLLMVKDFAAKRELSFDWRLMSNADASQIAFSADDDWIHQFPPKRELDVYFIPWSHSVEERPGLPIRTRYRVKNNLYNWNNWEIVP